MGKVLRMCVNWKVLGGLAATGLLIWLVAPGLFRAAAPLLLVAICPLSMLFMMRAMGREANGSGRASEGGEAPPAPRERVADLKTRLAAVRKEEEALARELSGPEASGESVPGHPDARGGSPPEVPVRPRPDPM